MKWLLGALVILGTALLGAAEQPPSPVSALGIDLVLPEGMGLLRLQPAVKGNDVAAAWEAFLGDWFSYFDTNGDGWLSREEAERIFPVPTVNGPVAFDFDKCDFDKDGKITLQEIKRFYLEAGFRPVQAVVHAPSLRDLQVAEAMFHHLGPDGAGSLTVEKLKAAERLLLTLDENEDEKLSMAEVLSLGIDKALTAASHSEMHCVAPTNQAVLATIAIAPQNAKSPQLQVEKGGNQLVVQLPHHSGMDQRISCGNVVLAFSPTPDLVGKAVTNSRLFVMAQFRNVVGSKGWLEKKQAANDPALQLLADIFPHADRDGDGKLTLNELEQFLALIERGATCVQVITVTDCGRNVFCHLDSNSDDHLDLKELQAAARALTALGDSKRWTRNQVPIFARIALGRGFNGGSFGPLPLVDLAPRSVAAARPATAIKAPAWFRAMDLNGDGYLSLSEFLGPIELFRLLDTNRDGLISAEEAEKARGSKQRH